MMVSRGSYQSVRYIAKTSTRGISTNNNPLTDSFGRYHSYLRISLTEKCNLRCVYCMPEEGVSLTPRDQLMTLEERKRLIHLFSHLGANKLRFTGGEPTVSNQLIDLIAYASTCNPTAPFKSIGITSNGLVLADKLNSLVSAGLTSVNISLDTLSATKFAAITRRDRKGHARVLSSIYRAAALGLPVKVNVVLMRGVNDDEVAAFVGMARELPNLDVRFIELMPFDGNEWSPAKFVGYLEVIDRLQSEHGITLRRHVKQSITSNSNGNSSSESQFDPHDTTKWYTAGPEPHGGGRVGFITSMSSHFCGGCNRLRVTADGKLKVCLFGEEGLSLRDAMRESVDDSELTARIGAAVLRKKEVLGGHGDAQGIAKSGGNRPMILIGG